MLCVFVEERIYTSTWNSLATGYQLVKNNMTLVDIDVLYVRVISGIVLSAVSIAAMKFLFWSKGPSILTPYQDQSANKANVMDVC
jgi:hypothetical protein